jgi:hypothetical protein
VAQVLERLPSKLEALKSNPNNSLKKKKQANGEGGTPPSWLLFPIIQFSVSPELFGGGPSPIPSFTLWRATQRNPQTRCRSWQTSSGCGNCPLEGDRGCGPLARQARSARRPPPGSRPVTRGAAVPRAVSCVPSASHGGGRPGLARPCGGRPITASPTAQSVPLLLPGKRERKCPLSALLRAGRRHAPGVTARGPT